MSLPHQQPDGSAPSFAAIHGEDVNSLNHTEADITEQDLIGLRGLVARQGRAHV